MGRAGPRRHAGQRRGGVNQPIPTAAATANTPAGTQRVMLTAVLFIGGFWWLATGLVVAIQRDDETRVVALAVATALACVGGWLIRERRMDATPAGARASLLGGSLIWAWIAVTFYAGWIVGPGPGSAAVGGMGPGPSLALALDVLRATSWNEAVSLGCLVGAWALCRGAPNRLGFQVLLLFWGMHQLARLNIFVGVVNPATRFLPERLLWLADYFGPERNTPFLALSVLLLVVVAGVLLHRARTADGAFGRHAAAMLGVLVVLGALEHGFMGLSANMPLWDLFLGFRG